MALRLKTNKSIILICLGAMAGLLYNSWPLGYILNNHTATVYLASNLEATGQPYNWLFILGDVLTGLVIMVVCGYYWSRKNITSNQLVKVTIAGFLIFGLLTIISALIPYNCQESIAECSVQLTSSFGLHDIFAAIASIGQFLSIYGAVLIILREGKIAKWSKIFASLVGIGFCIVGVVFLSASLSGNSQAVFLQHLFIIISGVGMLLIPIALNLRIHDKPVFVESENI